jgi:xylulokinase
VDEFKMAFVSLDVGSSAIKCVLYDLPNKVICYEKVHLPKVFNENGFVDLACDKIKPAVFNVLKSIINKSERNDIEAICITSFGETMVFIDKKGDPICNTPLYYDSRGADQCAKFIISNNVLSVMHETGNYCADSIFSIFKIRWLKEHFFLENVKHAYFLGDYICYLLGAEHETVRSLAIRSCMYSINNNAWNENYVNFSGINIKCLPHVLKDGSIMGRMSTAIANEIGIKKKALILLGGHDQIVMALGAGVIKRGDVANGLGSCDNITVLVDSNSMDYPALYKHKQSSNSYFSDNVRAVYSSGLAGTNLTEYFFDTFCKDLQKGNLFKAIEMETSDIPSHLLSLPHIYGSGTSSSNECAAILGIKSDTSRGEIYKALLEGEIFEIKRRFDCLESMGIQINNIVTLGGGTNSVLWMQLRADILGKNILVPKNMLGGGVFGCALIIYCALGLCKSYEDAIKEYCVNFHVYHPRPQYREAYIQKFKKYEKFSEFVKNLHQ